MQTKIVLSASVLVFAAQLVSAGPASAIKRGTTTVSNIQDNDLIDAKGAAVDISLLGKRCKSTTDVTNIQDNDLIDA
ncbi:unnamed protein product, partial [Tilletia caries]